MKKIRVVLPGEEVAVSLNQGAARAAAQASSLHAVVAAVIGNTLEWFDFAVYGYFALTISNLFFPVGNATTSLLLTMATFGVGFIMRPIGAIVLGTLGDTRGRKATLALSILLMALGTAMIGFAPTYAAAGIWAPVWLVIARLIQGFSAGGEVGGATTFLVEHASVQRRGYFASWQQASQALGLLIGSLFAIALTSILSPAEMKSVGWRIPFFFGLLIGPVGWYIRSRTRESEEFRRAITGHRSSPLRTAAKSHVRVLLVGFGMTTGWTVWTYFFFIYMPTYAVRTLGLAQSASFVANSVALTVFVACVPLFGALSDKTGRRPLMMASAAAILLLTYPALSLLGRQHNVGTLISVQAALALLIAAFNGPAPAALAELYPPEVRSTGVSVAYGFAVTIFGGFAPFISIWMIAHTGNPLAPAWYVMFAAAVSLIALRVSA